MNLLCHWVALGWDNSSNVILVAIHWLTPYSIASFRILFLVSVAASFFQSPQHEGSLCRNLDRFLGSIKLALDSANSDGLPSTG
jgi:hypothetical protein